MTPRNDYQFDVLVGQDEIIVDSFAGGGGASLGIQWALGRGPHVAINHDKEAIALHRANHPDSEHYPEDVWHVDPVAACRGRKVGLMWLSPDCFPAGTLVLTRAGYRAIETVRVGDEVFTHRARWRKVTELGRAVKPIMRVRGHGHPGLAVTPEHPFYVRQHERHAPSWAPASVLTKGVYWASPVKFPEEPIPLFATSRQLAFNADLMWLIGRYLGDGWTRLTSTRAELVITCGPSEIDELRARLNRWPRVGARSGDNELAWHERRTRTAYQFTTSHRGLVEWLRKYFGHRAEGKGLPSWVFGMDVRLRHALLDGYISADGYTAETFTECTTVSKALAFSIKTLAQSLGKTVAVYTGGNSTVIEGREVNARPVFRLRWRHQLNDAHRQTWRANELEWTPVRDSEHTGETDVVYNIGVDGDESYVVEGIVVHNCKHFSKAKGGKPVSKKIRGLAWTAVRWAKAVRPRIIVLENVEEFQSWGPVLADGRPCPERKGKTFKSFVARLRRLGYVVEWKELRACDYGAPTIRKRLFLIARCDGQPIVWPAPTHGKGRELPWRTAAECIDWSIVCPSIFERKKALADNTLRRIARGIKRYVIDSPKPFIVQYYSPKRAGDHRIADIDAPLPTSSTENRFGIVTPIITNVANGGTTGRGPNAWSVGDPLRTITSAPSFAVVSPLIIGAGGPAYQGEPRTADLPHRTILAESNAAIVSPPLVPMQHENRPTSAEEPLQTVTTQGNKFNVVAPLLVPTTHEGDARAHSLEEPTRTITGAHRGEHALIAPTLIQTGYGEDKKRNAGAGQPPRALDIEAPLGTVVGGGVKHALCAAFLAKHYGGHETPGASLEDPASTITTQDHHHLVTAHVQRDFGRSVGSDLTAPAPTITGGGGGHAALVASTLTKFKGTAPDGQPIDEPLHTVQAGGLHYGEVRAFLVSYYGTEQASGDLRRPTPTVTSKDRLGLVTIEGIEYAIADIGMRMLAPRELYRAQGFPNSYRIEIEYTNEDTGKTGPLTKTAQVRMCGNSVCPPLAAAIVSANLLGETFAPNRVRERVA